MAVIHLLQRRENTSVDIASWNLDEVKILPPSGFSGDITLTVAATSRELSNNDTATTQSDITVTVLEADTIDNGIDPDLVGDGVTVGTSGSDNLAPGSNSVTARVDTPTTFTPQNTGVGAFSFNFTSALAGVSIVSIGIDLNADGDDGFFDISGGGSLAPNIVTDIGGAGGTINTTDGSAVLTATFQAGDFTAGDNFSFDVDTDAVGAGSGGGDDGGDFGDANATVTITFSDGSTQTATYVTDPTDSDVSEAIVNTDPTTIVSAGAGDDDVTGGDAGELLVGGDGGDDIIGNGGNDVLVGGAGNDTLNGGADDDLLVGGAGNDTLTGGLGVDVFAWELNDGDTAGTPAVDTITDFDAGGDSDVLDLRDLLVGEDGSDLNNLDDYLFVETQGANTEIHISTSGGFSGGFNSANVEQTIVVENADLLGGFASQQALLQDLINNGKLIVD